MLIIERSDARTSGTDHLLSDDDVAALTAAATSPNLVPFEILGESVVPGLTQVPLILQGTFIQITNTAGTTGSITLQYKPTVPFVAAPPGGKIKLTANYIYSDLSINDITSPFIRNPSLPTFGFGIPAGGTIIVGVQYVATGLTQLSALAATEAAGNRGSVQLSVSSGSSFLVTATVRQVFVNQQTLATIAAAAYAVPNAAGPLVTG